jgi:hypothetical protein
MTADDLPQGIRTVQARAAANGFDLVLIVHGRAEIERKVKEPLFDEDGRPLFTDKGNPRSRMVPGRAQVASIGVKLWHSKAGQRQAGVWINGLFDAEHGWAWPADGSDCRRHIGANQLGTVLDLDALRERAIERARIEMEAS